MIHISQNYNMKKFKIFFALSAMCISFIGNDSILFSKKNYIENNVTEYIVDENITANHSGWLDHDDNLYQTDFYSPYYFSRLTKNYGYNVKGSCTYIAFDMLLSFYDTYWDDSYIPENYDMNEILDSNNFTLDYIESPGTYGEELSLVRNKTTEEYYNLVEKYSNFYHHLKLIEIGKQIFRQYKFENSNSPCGLTSDELLELANYYLYDVIGKSKSEVSIVTNFQLNMNVKDFMIYMISRGIPVELRAGSSNGGGHAMVAYDYDKKTDTIYVHPGWRGYSEDTHVTIESTGYTNYWDATAIIPNTKHKHSNNFKYIEKYELTETYCPSMFVVPSEIHVEDNYAIDVPPTFKWNSLIKENWFKDIGLYHEFSILDSNRHTVFTKTHIFDNKYTLSLEEWKRVISTAGANYYVYIGLASDVDPYWDDYYYSQSFHEPYRFFNKSSFLPSDWGFQGRYYFSNELNDTNLANDPSIKNTTITMNDLTINTDRLRCGYIENSYVVLSPRRENAGRSYFEMNFNKAVYSFMYRACLWSYNEKIDGVALIQTKDALGNWTTLKDIPLSLLKSRADGLTVSIEQTPTGIYGLRFEVTSTAEGTRNLGRFCLDDLVFSTKSGTQNNTYSSTDYTKTTAN